MLNTPCKTKYTGNFLNGVCLIRFQNLQISRNFNYSLKYALSVKRDFNLNQKLENFINPCRKSGK